MSVHGYTDDEYEAASNDSDGVIKISRLDVSDPLHLHPNDSASLTVISVKLKGIENYQVWSYAMILALEGKNKTGFIDGTYKRSNVDEVLGRQWDRVNAVVLGWILNSITKELFLGENFLRGLNMFRKSLKKHMISSSSSFSDEQLYKIIALIKDNIVSSHGKVVQPNMIANQHLIYTDKDLVDVIDISKLGIKVSHPNGTKAFITKVGNMILNKDLTLYDVLVVPEYCVSHISVHKIARDSKFVVAFDESSCYILPQGLMEMKLLGTDLGVPYDDNHKASSQSDGSSFSQSNSLTIDQTEDELGHLQGSNGSVSEDEIVVTFDEHISNSEGINENMPNLMSPQGYNKKEGIDFDETFSPVVKIVTMRCLINLVVQNDWPMFQLDINNAFLYGDLDETVYMALPDGYFDKNDKRVCRLNKSLYVLKQASRQWNAKLTQDLVEHGNSIEYIEKFKKFLRSKFQIKDLGKLRYFLPIEVIDTNNSLCLSQRKYCLDLLSDFGLLACKPSATPHEQNLVIANEPSNSDPVLDNITEYQKLIYLSHTRPDVSYVVHCLSQFMHKTLRSYLKIALKVLSYLKGYPGKGIQFVKCPSVSLETFMDAD
uniref:Ribonuclease H-like domain-containing protein n=1 Tax=Tanacetum cinerariifolium TaxID=118510 RepID=A0A6L2JM57_TANCI|nr:ribonuclease H-like domain-containing protein [Tanacetum cinerariifolium]